MSISQTDSQFPDSILLKHYLQDGNEAAFGELVERYQSLVLGAAFRRAGDVEMARDVAQQVFAALARKANLLMDRDSLAGWLHQATMYETCRALQADGRRRQRYALLQLEQPEPAVEYANQSTDWAMLDEAVDRLSFADRESIAMHYFQDLSYPEMAAVLGVNEAAVRKRVSRALQRLSENLRERGVRQTAAALLAGALALQNTLVVPGGLAQTALALAAAGGGASAFLSLTAVMSKTVVKTAAVIVAATSIYMVWPTAKASKASSVPENSAFASAAVTAEDARVTEDTPATGMANAQAPGPSPSGMNAGSSNAGNALGAVVGRRGGNANAAKSAVEKLSSQERVQFAQAVGDRVAERLGAPVAAMPTPVADQAFSLEIGGVSPDLALSLDAGPLGLGVDGLGSTLSGLVTDMPDLSNVLRELEHLPTAAADFYSEVLSTALGLTPVEHLRVRDVLDDHFSEQALSGLAGMDPLAIGDQQLRGYRSALVEGTVERVIEAAPVAGAVPHIVEEVLTLGDRPLLGGASNGGGHDPLDLPLHPTTPGRPTHAAQPNNPGSSGGSGGSGGPGNPGDAGNAPGGGVSLPEILTGRLPGL